MLFQRGTGASFNDLWLLPLEGDRKPRPYIASSFNEMHGAISPDETLIAYSSNESGPDEIYVRPFAGTGRVQISVGGGIQPAWSSNGQELFYLSDKGLMGATVASSPDLKVSPARLLLDAASGRFGGVSTDGRRFLMIKNDAKRVSVNFTIVTGWFEELRKKMGVQE